MNNKGVKIALLILLAAGIIAGLFGLIGVLQTIGQHYDNESPLSGKQKVAAVVPKEKKEEKPVEAPKKVEAAVAQAGSYDVAKSPYYTKYDFTKAAPTKSALLITGFTTYQQQQPYTCGAAAALMVVHYLDKASKITEQDLVKELGTNNIKGTQPERLVKYFEKQGYVVESSLKGRVPASPAEFKGLVVDKLTRHMPVIVENVEIGGHYRVIIGYDDMGTAATEDDVLIMADPYDYYDHAQDGYSVVSASKFYYMWFDAKLYRGKEAEKFYVAVGK